MTNADVTVNLAIGFVGVGLSLLSFSMRNMQALRQLAIASNVAFIVFGLLESQLPTIVSAGLLLPLNTWRLFQIKRLVRDIENAKADTPVAEWLLPHMRAVNFAAGTVLFRQGDTADDLYYVHEGSVRIEGINVILCKGDLFGEMGIFSTARVRTTGVRCETDCKLYMMSRETVTKLYYQEPKLGFHIVRLIIDRLTKVNAATQFHVELAGQPSLALPKKNRDCREDLS